MRAQAPNPVPGEQPHGTPAGEPTEPAEERAGGGLPFEPRTILLGFWKRRYTFTSIALAGMLAAFFGSALLATRSWDAATLLLYQPTVVAGTESGDYVAPPLSTQLHMVKLRANLEETRQRLQLSTGLKTLAGSLKVDVQRKTELMTIRARWDSPETAAALANTFRDVFLENQVRMRRTEAGKLVGDLEARLALVLEELAVADARLGEFTAKHDLIDLEQETQWYLDELTSLDVLYEQALIHRKTIDLQSENLSEVINNLKQRVAKEKAEASSMDALSEVNIRIERLRENIDEERSEKINVAELSKLRAEYERAAELRDDGLISDADYEKAEAAYLKQAALTLDSEKIRAWKDQIDKLDEIVLPTTGGTTPSGGLLHDMMLRAFNIQLEQVAAQEQVESLDVARSRVKAKLGTLPELKRDFVELTREVTAREAERNKLEEVLTKAKRVQASETSDFSIISQARQPIRPSKSNRKILFLAMVALSMAAAGGVVVAAELTDLTVKSAPELAQKLSLPVFGAVPNLRAWTPPRDDNDSRSERFRRIAARFRRAAPAPAACVLVASAAHGEGKTSVAADLAACLGRQGETVLLVNAQIRGRGEDAGLENLAELPEARSPLEERLSRAASVLRRTLAKVRRTEPKGPAEEPPADVEERPSRLSRLVSTLTKLGAPLRRMLLVSGDTSGGERESMREIAGIDDAGPLRGLGEYLVSEDLRLGDVTRPSRFPGVDCVLGSRNAIDPHRLSSHRMRRLLEEARSAYSVVLVDGPPVLPYADAEALAPAVDGVLFVARAESTASGTVKKAVARLRESGTPVLGAVLVGVTRLYQELE